MDDAELREWFVSAILPLEPQLLSFLRHHSSSSDCQDLLHDVYERLLGGIKGQLPLNARAYTFVTARNLLITRAKRARIVSLELVADMADHVADFDMLTPERSATAREELRRALEGLDRLPDRSREVVRLRKLEGLSTREVADRLNVSMSTVEREMTFGMRSLVDFMLGGQDRQNPQDRGLLSTPLEGAST